MFKRFFPLLVFVLAFFVINAQIAPKDWYHMDPSEGFNGVSVNKTYQELLKDRTSTTVVVAIIDSGVDIDHEDLQDNIWINSGEIPDNGIDDDGNGYIDDVHGWNFIGGPNGQNVGPDTYEVTRLYGALKYKYENANPALLNKKDLEEYNQFIVYREKVEKETETAQKRIDEIKGATSMIYSALDAVEMALDTLELNQQNLDSIDASADQMLAIGKNIISELLKENPEVIDISEMRKELDNAIAEDSKRFRDQLDYAYNPDYDPRKTIVKDNYSDSRERIYGNNDVDGPDSFHGTHVAGIVGAVRNNDVGMNGIADNVKIMSVRTVPDGDERDKDVANAIRYAVDNGASIINMSFGKGFSWDKEVVDDAVKYAVEHDVLLVHAAGNSAQDNDETDNFPNNKYDKAGGWFLCRKKEAKTWMEIGALSFQKDEKSVAGFSNYGKDQVDIFSPGVQIYATVPNDGYRYLQGTSMASPVVAGMAAVLRSYFPSLKAEQVKEIILESGVPLNIQVIRPGANGEMVEFSSLSQTGKIVNLYNAVKLASQTKGKKKVKKGNGNA